MKCFCVVYTVVRGDEWDEAYVAITHAECLEAVIEEVRDGLRGDRDCLKSVYITEVEDSGRA